MSSQYNAVPPTLPPPHPRTWYHTHLRMGLLASSIWLLFFSISLRFVGWLIAMVVSFGPEQTLGWYEIKVPAIFTVQAWTKVLMMWGLLLVISWCYNSLSSVREERYGNRFARLIGGRKVSEIIILRPLLVLLHGVAGVWNALLIANLTGNTWVSISAPECEEAFLDPARFSSVYRWRWRLATLTIPVAVVIGAWVLDYVQVGIGKTAINLATMLSGAVSAALIVSWYMEELESDAQTCWFYSGPGLLVLSQSFMFGLFYGVHYLYHDKNLLKFDAIHQKVVLWRILARRNGILAFGCTLSWQYCRVVFVFYQIVELLFAVDFETELAHFLGHTAGAPLISHDKVGWAFLVFSCAASAAIWEFTRAILEISLTQLRYPDSRSMPELIEAIEATDVPLLRHLGFIQLDRRLRCPDVDSESSLFRAGVNEPEAIEEWEAIVRGCAGVLTEVQNTELGGMPLYNSLPPFEIPVDYTHRPFDNPANVGQKVKPNKGWQKVELRPDPRLKPWKVSQPKPDRSILGKIRKLLVWVHRLKGRWALYLQINESWYRSKDSQLESTALLQHQRNGTFVIHAYTPQQSEDIVYAPHEARTLTVVRDTHPDHGSNIVTSGGSNWSGSIVNEPGLGYHLVSRPNVKGHEQRFPTLELLVQHYAHHPYEIDFAGGRFKLLDITQPGPMYSATANAMSGLYRRVMDRIRSQSIVRYLISKSEDDYRRDLWYDFNCTIWAARCLSFAARDCTRHEQTAAAHVIHDKFGEIVVELLRTLTAVDAYILNPLAHPTETEVAEDWSHPSFPAATATGRRLRVVTSRLPSEDFGCRQELRLCLCRVIRAYPENVARMLQDMQLTQPRERKMLSDFLAKEPIHFTLIQRFNDVIGSGPPPDKLWTDDPFVIR